MSKSKALIFTINTRNKSFNLLEEVYKDFGVVFHPKTTVDSVANFVKEKKQDAKATSETSGKVRQADSERTGLVGKAEKVKEQQKSFSMEDTQNKISSSFSILKREDK